MRRNAIFQVLSMTPAATAEAQNAQLTEWHLNKYEFNSGDKAIIYLTIKNNSGTGSINISRDGSIKGSYDVSVKVPIIGTKHFKKTIEYKVSDLTNKEIILKPGDKQTVDNRDKPNDVTLPPGVSGNGTFDAALLLNGAEIGHIKGTVKITDGLSPKLTITKG